MSESVSQSVSSFERNSFVRSFVRSFVGVYGTFSTNRLYHAIEVGNISHGAGDNTNTMQLNNEIQ